MDQVAELVVRAQTGDRAAYDALVARFEAMALSYAYSMLGDRELAEDARQEAFIGAWCDLGALREPRAFPGWFRTLVRRHTLRLALGRRRALTVPLEEAGEPAAGGPGPRQTAEQRETRERLTRAIAQLPLPEQTATHLFYLEGLSLKEVGRRLGLPVQTVSSRLHTARARLRQRMMEMVKKTVQHQHQSGDRRPRQAAGAAALALFEDEIAALLHEPSPAERREQRAEHERRAGELLRAKGRLHRFRGEVALAMDAFERGRALPTLRREGLIQARLCTEVGLTHLHTGDYQAARRELEGARRALSDGEIPAWLAAMIDNGLGACAWGEGQLRPAEEHFTRALEVASRDVNAGSEDAVTCRELAADAENNLGLLHWKAGRLTEALAHLQAGLRLWRKLGNRHGQALTLMNVGILEENLGRGALARRHYGQALTLAEELDYTLVRVAAHGNLGSLALGESRWGEAAAESERSLELARASGDRRGQAIALENLALARLGQGRLDAGRESLKDAVQLARDLGDTERLFSLDLVAIELRLESKGTGRAAGISPEMADLLDRLAQAESELAARGYEAERPRLLRLRAAAESRAGRPAEAVRQTVDLALRECRRQKNKPEEKRLRILLQQLRQRLED